jgi:hypothetical protein
MGRFKRPLNWRDEVRPVYEEEGRAIGKYLMHNRSKEPDLWAMLGPTKVWPRFYLFGFATLYKDENPREYERFKKNRQNARKRAGRRAQEAIERQQVIDDRLNGD